MFSAVLSITTRQSQRDLTDLGALSPALESLVDVIGLIGTSWRWPPGAHRERSHHRAETSIGGSAGSMVVSTSRCSPGSLAAMDP
jgi:hypothetical protein